MKVTLTDIIKTRFKIIYNKHSEALLVKPENDKQKIYFNYTDGLAKIFVNWTKGKNDDTINREEKELREKLLVVIPDDKKNEYKMGFIQICEIGKIIKKRIEEDSIEVV